MWIVRIIWFVYVNDTISFREVTLNLKQLRTFPHKSNIVYAKVSWGRPACRFYNRYKYCV